MTRPQAWLITAINLANSAQLISLTDDHSAWLRLVLIMMAIASGLLCIIESAETLMRRP